MENVALAISIAALITSVLSPLISALVSGLFRRNEKKMELNAEIECRNHEFYIQHRAEAIERYITAVGSICKRGDLDALDKYGAAMGEVYLYLDQEYWPLLDSISKKLSFYECDDVTVELETLCKKLADEKVRFPHEKQPAGRHHRLPH